MSGRRPVGLRTGLRGLVAQYMKFGAAGIVAFVADSGVMVLLKATFGAATASGAEEVGV